MKFRFFYGVFAGFALACLFFFFFLFFFPGVFRAQAQKISERRPTVAVENATLHVNHNATLHLNHNVDSSLDVSASDHDLRSEHDIDALHSDQIALVQSNVLAHEEHYNAMHSDEYATA